jgi:histidinol-phosphatase (PHP family)
MAQWSVRDVDMAWDDYVTAIEELAATAACDVLAHPDLVKAAGHRPVAPEECWDRLVEAALCSGMAAELSSAGWRKPAQESYPAPGLLARFAARGVPLTTASDAHRLADVSHRTADLASMLEALDVSSLRAFRARRGVDVPVGTTAPTT